MKYFGSISDDKDLVNKKYVDDLVLAQAPKMSDIADEFDSTKTYNYGDYASHNNHIYKYTYITPTSGTWDDLKWEQIVVCNEISAEGTVDSPLYLHFSDDAQTLFEAASDAAQSGNALYIIDRSSPVPCAFCGSEVDLSTGDTTHIFSGWDGAGSYIEIQVYNSDNTYGKFITKKSQDTFSKIPNIIAAEFDSTRSYQKGEYVRRNGKLYRKLETSAGTGWSASDWVEVTVCTEISRVFKTAMNFGTWSGNDPYYATMTPILAADQPTPTANMKIDIQPSVAQISSMQADGITALVAVNDLGVSGGTIKAYAFGGIPSFPSVQCTMVEVL